MKRFLLSFVMVLSAFVFANAQTNVHPTIVFPVIEDSSEAATGVWDIGSAADYDTSLWFSVKNAPLTGLTFQFYWNDTDTGDFEFQIQGTSLYDAFAADSAAAVDYISIWSTLVTVPITATTGRQTYIYPSTLTQDVQYVRLIIGKKTSSGIRSVAVYATRQS